jgi:hypothetical protein
MVGDEKAAFGLGISPDTPARGGGRCQRSRPSKLSHQTIDGVCGELLGFDGEMRVEAGGRRRTVTEVLLNEAKVDAGLQ